MNPIARTLATMGEARAHPNNRTAARRIVSILRQAGHVAYFAGGCVRDELLGLHPQDYDIATDATPDRVAALFNNTRAVGRAFGVVLVRLSGTTVEVATFREEAGYSDHRRPDSVRFADAQTDARRRDFTINALFLDPLSPAKDPLAGGAATAAGHVIDFVGGLDDLRDGIIRAVGDPDARLAEDHLRGLRGVRFAARLAFQIDPATERAIARHARELRGVSRERIGEELRKAFAHPSRARAADLLHRTTLDGPALDGPPLGPIDLPRLAALPAPAGVADPMPGLAAWAADRLATTDPAPSLERWHALVRQITDQWRAALCLTNEERDALRGILTTLGQLRLEWVGLSPARRKRAAASPWFATAHAVLGTEHPEASRAIAHSVSELSHTPSGISPDPLISGYDLIDAGYRPGPGFARCLEAVYDAQLEDRIADRAKAMEMVRRLLGPAGAQ